MAYLAAPLARLVEQLERLPSVGHKSAQRLAFHILNMPDKSAEALVASIQEARAQIHECKVCHNLTDHEICPICSADLRG